MPVRLFWDSRTSNDIFRACAGEIHPSHVTMVEVAPRADELLFSGGNQAQR